MNPSNQPTRVIKFRAWIKSSKEMVTEEPSDYILVSNGGGFGVIDNSNDEEWSNGKWLNEIDFEIMQFTGLTDKNGKEIYEGDIVRGGTIKSKSGIKDMNLLVEYRHGIFEPVAYMADEALEVVGNIYENGDLL